jgi:hypothetical protein
MIESMAHVLRAASLQGNTCTQLPTESKTASTKIVALCICTRGERNGGYIDQCGYGYRGIIGRSGGEEIYDRS